MIKKGIWIETTYKLKDLIRLISKCGQNGYDGKPISSLMSFYNRQMDYYNGISVAFRMVNIHHPEDVVMYIYIETSRINWITHEMLNYPVFAEDILLRRFSPDFKEMSDLYVNDKKADYLIGKIQCQSVDSVICRRSGLLYDKEVDAFILKLRVRFPTGSGSTILGKRMARFISEILKLVDKKTMCDYKEETDKRFRVYLRQQRIREWCQKNGYITFIADGSILPRQGDNDAPSLTAIPFKSPEKYKVSIPLYDGETITGMGLKRGVTVITGAGFSGKTTLLEAIDAGIFDHILGDGREYVISDKMTLVTNAEDGRYIGCTDMSPFFFKIPGHNCHCFSTGDASGSVSQAANIIEAIQAGAKLLLIDEDKGATNFMICDSKMRQIVPEEIIIPFTDRIDELIKKKQISCILVIGGSSEYFHYADNILVMKNYQPNTIDSDQEIMLRCDIKHQRSLPLIKFSDKYINLSDDDITKSLFSIVNAEKIKKVIVGQCSADISALTSIKDDCQLHGIAVGVYNAMLMSLTDRKSLKRLVEDSMSVFWVDRINEGYALDKMFRHWFVSEVRPLDVIITMNRMRGFDFSQQDEVGHE